ADLSPPVESFTQFPTEITLTGPATRELGASASVPGLSVSIRAVPERFRFTFGDGAAANIGEVAHAEHTYTRWGCFELRAEVSWRGEYSVNDGAYVALGVPNSVTAGSFTRPVNQIVGVLVDKDNPNPAK